MMYSGWFLKQKAWIPLVDLGMKSCFLFVLVHWYIGLAGIWFHVPCFLNGLLNNIIKKRVVAGKMGMYYEEDTREVFSQTTENDANIVIYLFFFFYLFRFSVFRILAPTYIHLYVTHLNITWLDPRSSTSSTCLSHWLTVVSRRTTMYSLKLSISSTVLCPYWNKTSNLNMFILMQMCTCIVYTFSNYHGENLGNQYWPMAVIFLYFNNIKVAKSQ